MNKSESIKSIAAALNAFQAGMRSIKEESENPFFKSKYADLPDIWKAIRPGLANNGLSVIQGGRVVNGEAVLVTTVMHVSGEWIEGEYPIVSKDKTPQGLGSGNTYARRYALSGMLGLTTDQDDDGEGSMGRGSTSGGRETAPAQPPKPQNGNANGNGQSKSAHIHLEIDFECPKAFWALTRAEKDKLLGDSLVIRKERIGDKDVHMVRGK